MAVQKSFQQHMQVHTAGLAAGRLQSCHVAWQQLHWDLLAEGKLVVVLARREAGTGP